MHLLISCKNYFEALPSLLDLSVPEEGPDVQSKPRFTVCGDTHGQFYDVLNIFKINGYPSVNVSNSWCLKYKSLHIQKLTLF
jgi:serine/threonine-protein phosphatase 5